VGEEQHTIWSVDVAGDDEQHSFDVAGDDVAFVDSMIAL
jgi:hypothetical protein